MASKSFFTEQITGLYNGVSTQPDLMRLENQAEEQINFISDISRGLESRNGTELLNALDYQTNASSNSYITKIDKTTIGTGTNAITEDYIVVFTGVDYNASTNPNGPIEIYDLNGVQQNYSNASSSEHDYLVTTTPRASIRTAVIEDYMIITNSEKTTAMTADLSPSADESKVVIYIKQLQPSATYQIFLGNNVVAEHTLNNVNNPDTLLGHLRDDINNANHTDISATYTASVEHGNLIITKNSGSIRGDAFTTVDTYGDTLLGVLNGHVVKASDLPPAAPDGTLVHVVGVDEQNTLADYYLKYNATEHVWKESLAPGIKYKLDKATMPHFLIKTGTSTNSDGVTIANFQLVQAGDSGLGNQQSAKDYGERQAGDNDSNPIPSFIGKKIIDLQFYRNRLVYLGEDSIVMSRANDYFNLFNDSAIRALNDDPIDVFLGSNFSVRPKFMEQYEGGLIVFTENQQYVVHSADQALSPSTVRAEFLTDFSVNENVHPVRLGNSIYFADTMGANAVIRKYITKQGNLVRDAVEVTSHVDTYIPKDVKFMFGIPNKNIVLVGVESEPKTLYVYFTYEQGGKLVQSSWSKFTFNFDIYGAVSFDNDIYFVDASGSNKNISKLSLFDHSKELQVDQFVTEGNSNYNITPTPDNFQEYSLPFLIEEDNSLICIEEAGGKINDIHSTVRSEITAPGAGEYQFTSKAIIPTLEKYIPHDLTLSNSYIPAYNGDYNLNPASNTPGFLAYKKKDETTKLIDYNSTTQKYEIKGLGADPTFPDFVADYSTPPDPKVLPSQKEGGVNNNTWKININKNGTAEERDTFGNFVGAGSAGLKGNYVELPTGNTLAASSDFDIDFTIFLDSTGPANACVFSTDSKSVNNSVVFSLCRVGTSTDAHLYVNDGVTSSPVLARHDFYVDNIFDNTWSDININWYYGTLTIRKNGKVLPTYNKSKLDSGTRKRKNTFYISHGSNTISSLQIPLSPLSLMTEDGGSVTCKGYMADFKVTHNTTGGGLNFDGTTNGVTINTHELRDHFKLILRGEFDPTSDDGSVVYCNQDNDQGFYHRGMFAFKYLSGTKSELKFVGSSHPAHYTFRDGLRFNNYNPSPQSLYFDGGLWDNTEKKVEIEYNAGGVQVRIDDVAVSTYSDEALTTLDSTVTHYGGFGFSTFGRLMTTTRYTVVGTEYPTASATQHFTKGKLRYCKIDSISTNGIKPLFESKFLDAQGSTPDNIRIADISGRGNHAYFYIHESNDNQHILQLTGNNQFVEAPHVSLTNNQLIEFELKFNIKSNEEHEWLVNQAGSFEIFVNDPTRNDRLHFRFGRTVGSTGGGSGFAYNKTAVFASDIIANGQMNTLNVTIDPTQTTNNVTIRVNGMTPTNNNSIKDYDFSGVTFNSTEQRNYPFMFGAARAFNEPFEGNEMIYPWDFGPGGLGRWNLLNVNLHFAEFKQNNVTKFKYDFKRGDNGNLVYDISGRNHHAKVLGAAGHIIREGTTGALETNDVLSPRFVIATSGASRTTNWITTADVTSIQLHYDFKESSRTGSYSGATNDPTGTNVGSLVDDKSSNNWDAKMVINSILNYADTWVTPPSITYKGRTLSFGYPTENKYTLSPFFLRRNGERVATGRLNIKSLDVSFQEVVNFALEVQVKNRDTYTKQFAQGVGQTITDTLNVQSGVHKFGLNSETNNLTLTIKNDTPYRSRFVAVGYEGSFVNRSKIK